MTQPREIKEGRQEQGEGETIVYTLTTTKWGSDPTSPVPKVYTLLPNRTDQAIDADVTSTVMPSGSATVSGDIITWPAMTSLTMGRTYRFEMQFTISGNVFEAFAIIDCNR